MPAPLANTNLFKPIKVGNITLPNRLVHAPTTRSRNTEDFIATDSMQEYYVQRAHNNGGLIIAEATFPTPELGVHVRSPVFDTDRQVAAWKKIVEAVHKEGSPISLQIFALGNDGDANILKRLGFPLIGASEVYYDDETKKIAEEAGNPLHELSVSEIADVIAKFAAGAKRAVDEAGFDFLEVHAANMYLLDQFLNVSTNHRTDKYGGSLENRARLILETVDAVIEAIGAERTAVRLSPYSLFHAGEGVYAQINPAVSYGYVLSELERRAKEGKRIAYLSFVEPRIAGNTNIDDPAQVTTSWVNEIWKGVILRTGGLLVDPEYAQLKQFVDGDDRTLIGVSRYYTSNPDLAERLKKGQELTKYDRPTFYTVSNQGFTTWGKYGEKDEEDEKLPEPLA